MKKYLKNLELKGVRPNFWCSLEYFELAGFKAIYTNNEISIWDEDVLVFPPIGSKFPYSINLLNKSFWASFSNMNFTNTTSSSFRFLDYEYIYDPNNFKNLTGKKWKVFRKNIKKWANKNEDWKYYRIEGNKYFDILKETLIKWLRTFPKDRIVHDSEVLLQYMKHGKNIKGLFNSQEEIVSINIWDTNYQFINYRYCICKPEPFLSEFTRYLFYQDPEILKQKKFINDGGTLDQLTLKQFKDKLNPIKINKIYSYIKVLMLLKNKK